MICQIVSGAGDVAPLGADSVQVAALGGWMWGSRWKNSLGKFLSSVKNPEAYGMSREYVQGALGYEVCVQKSNDWIGGQFRKASAHGG